MLRNYLKIAFPALHRHLGYTAINVVGLAVGIAYGGHCVLLVLFVRHAWTYDDFHE